MQYILSMEYYLVFFFLKGKPAICINMDEPGGHNAKGNNSVIKGQIRRDFTYMRCLKESNPEKLTVKWLPMAGRKGMGVAIQ